MDSYYVELARSAIQKAVGNLNSVQQYMASAGGLEREFRFVCRTIRGLENRNKELALYLMDGTAHEEP